MLYWPITRLIRSLPIFPLALTLALPCFQTPVMAKDSPEDTVVHMNRAVREANGEEFLKYVDLDAILDSTLTAFLEEANKPENASRLPPMLALVVAQASEDGLKGQTVRQLLRGEARAFVLSGINSGAFAGKTPDKTQFTGLLAPLFANASMGKKEIHDIGEAVEDGDAMLVPFTVHDYGNDQDYLVVGRFSPTSDGWRMTGFGNSDKLMNQIRDESEAAGTD